MTSLVSYTNPAQLDCGLNGVWARDYGVSAVKYIAMCERCQSKINVLTRKVSRGS